MPVFTGVVTSVNHNLYPSFPLSRKDSEAYMCPYRKPPPISTIGDDVRLR
ncbi:hypothetical protein DEO72_LG8g2616 [Vigna unguiculata]|uniref:Uncharacterized protein n=1 Tax=Vigna unguiculata TaxID=3917 RepID=A0A4D6MST4_VIGUN|nr:hypothetical protein DEO72_LG8g2616 [Vigna unguiculata]